MLFGAVKRSTPSRLLTSSVAVGWPRHPRHHSRVRLDAVTRRGRHRQHVVPAPTQRRIQRQELRPRPHHPTKDPAQRSPSRSLRPPPRTCPVSTLDFAGDAVAAVSVNEAPTKFSLGGGKLVITSARYLAKGRACTVAASGFKATPIIGTARRHSRRGRHWLRLRLRCVDRSSSGLPGRDGHLGVAAHPSSETSMHLHEDHAGPRAPGRAESPPPHSVRLG
jgi:hypothetical protein